MNGTYKIVSGVGGGRGWPIGDGLYPLLRVFRLVMSPTSDSHRAKYA